MQQVNTLMSLLTISVKRWNTNIKIKLLFLSHIKENFSPCDKIVSTDSLLTADICFFSLISRFILALNILKIAYFP